MVNCSKIKLLPFILLFVILPFPGSVQAQQCDATPFTNASHWVGTFTLTGNGSGSVPTSQGGTFKYSVNQSVTATLDMPVVAADTYAGPYTSVSINDTNTYTDPTGYSSSTQFVGNSALLNSSNFALSFNSVKCTYNLQFYPEFLTTTGNVGLFGPTSLQDPFVGQSHAGSLPLPTNGLNLSGTLSYSSPPLDGISTTPDQVNIPVQWTLSWSLAPKVNVDVIVDAIDPGWRPMGGRSETDLPADSLSSGSSPYPLPSDGLFLHAQLVTTDGSPLTALADKFTFTLVDVSHEPGVALNFPAQDKLISPTPPDLTFEPGFNVGVISADKLSIESLQPFQSTEDFFVISPHDWGAWGTLHVSALVGGVTIKGHLAGDLSAQDILIPSRQPGSLIADQWKKDKGVTGLPDGDDTESVPNGDEMAGDGLTLYEEYRGFYMGCSNNIASPVPEGSPGAVCQHIEGDPKTKDLFVVNQIGAMAAPGITQFENISHLKVHSVGLTLDEVGTAQTGLAAGGPVYRAINFNFSAAPHVGGVGKEQPPVVLGWGPPGGISQTVTTTSYPCPDNSHVCPALPALVDHIEISPGLDQAFAQMPTTVAHELGHAVNIYHHGDVGPTRIWALDSNKPPNVMECNPYPIQAICGDLSYYYAIKVITEDQDPSSASAVPFSFTGVDLSQLSIPCPVAAATCLLIPLGNDVCKATQKVILNGLHSGDENSVMRYFNAQAYVPDGFPNVRILIEPENFGFRLPDSPVGTGVNAPGRVPRPRYGNAYGGDGSPNSERGHDASQIDVNDNHVVNGAPSIIRKKQPVCP